MLKITTVLLYASLTDFSLILGIILGAIPKIDQKVIAAIMASGGGMHMITFFFGELKEVRIFEVKKVILKGAVP